MVDDAHLLDPLSAIVVHQLAVRGEATLIVTLRSETDVLDAITALWKDEYLLRVEVAALSHADTGRLITEAPAARSPAPSSISFTNSAGIPLLLRGLLDAAVTTARWSTTPGAGG